MTNSMSTTPADVCLILEGTYPYVAGGVSTWTHDLLLAHPELRFHLVSLLPKREERKARYTMPSNVVGIDHIYIQDMPIGARRVSDGPKLFAALEQALGRMQSPIGDYADLAAIIEALRPHRDVLGRRLLLNSEAAWNLLVRMYDERLSSSSFLDYFWSWRALVGGMYSVVLPPIPAAKVYHTASTGYAGLFAARARLETGRPVLVTEHGIYTNERRIEVAMADWLFEGPTEGLNVDIWRRSLKDMWTDTFASYSRACYAASERVITLYEGNQQFQLDDGALPEKLSIIPNGIAINRYAPLRREGAAPRDGGRPPHVALIGRVVPIKDIKTFIRACGMLRDKVADLKASIVGPYDEDPDYYAECRRMILQMELGSVVTFTGPVRLDQFLGQVDVQVLTSISEGMPLVVLEAGAAGIPSVVTDVGACREMILGRRSESPSFGPAGTVTPLSNPKATADACLALLTDRDWYLNCSTAMRRRVHRYYDKADQDRSYRALYDACMALPDRRPTAAEGTSLQAAE
ncbi:MAG: GT4 family glycosyltransferase PelF [Alphaproteobacteria bacterium]